MENKKELLFTDKKTGLKIFSENSKIYRCPLITTNAKELNIDDKQEQIIVESYLELIGGENG